MTIRHVRNAPYNGIDVSHWNGAPQPAIIRQHVLDGWLEFMGMKACHFGNKHMVNHVDPKFHANRSAGADAGVRWRGMFAYLSAEHPLDIQVLTLADTVGDLARGEFVFLDWEEHDIKSIDGYPSWLMNHIFPGRWAVYVNDSTPEMLEWMENTKVPIIHPDWTEDGWAAAERWQAAVWQVGITKVEGWTNPIDIDFVLDRDLLDRLTAQETTQ